MLNIAVAGVDDLLGRQPEGYVARERQVLAARLLRDREKRVARRMVVDLDQINASAFEQLNRGPAVLSGPTDAGS